jgi:hypothetical protein
VKKTPGLLCVTLVVESEDGNESGSAGLKRTPTPL